MPSVIYESSVTVLRRIGLPPDVTKLGSFYVRKKVVRIWLLVFWFIVPWVAIGLNYGFNRCLCSLPSVRGHSYLDGLCAGTFLSQKDKIPWYLDVWNMDQQVSFSAQSDQDLPLHIERFMSSHARLRHPILAITDQLSKTVDRHPFIASYQLTSSLQHVQSLVEELYPLFANSSRIFAMERDAMNHRLITFIHTYTASLSRSKPEAMLGWFEILFIPWWHCLSMFQRHTGSRLLPISKVHRSFVLSEIRFQMTRLVDESVASLDRINDSFLAVQQGPDSTSSSAPLASAVAAVEMFRHRLKETWPDTGLFTWSWFGPRLTSTGIEYRKLYEDDPRSKRMLARLEEIRQVITILQSDLEILQDSLNFLHNTFMSIAAVDLAAEGVVALPQAFQEHLAHETFSWMRQDWSIEPSQTAPAAIESVQFHFDLDRANQKDLSDIRSALMLVCNDKTNTQLAGGAIHMICAIQKYARAFSKLDNRLIYGIQRSWLTERAEAQRRYEKNIGATYEHVADVAIHALELHEQGGQVPEYLE
ncbi:MAG: hypothetical protein Q9171_001794 [Xanthocarpia ochracea]